MLKVFLVEDEFIVREGIKNNIDWAGEGFEFCGEAADGERAYPLIQSTEPDIIITDIKMPFMNGLELSRLVLKEFPQCKIIILSGHEEFSFAQEAIKIGVTEYLLKPIKASELVKTVKRIGQQIIQERIEKESYERYKREMEENETQARVKLFNDMVSGSLSIVNIIERGKELGLILSAKLYQIVLFKYSILDCDDAYSNEMVTVEKQLNNVYAQFGNIIVFDRSIEGMAFLLKGDNSQQIDSMRREFIDAIKAVLSGHPQVRYFGGTGKQVTRITSLYEAYESAARAFSHRFLSEKSAIIDYNELPGKAAGEGNIKTLSSLEIGSLDLKKADAFLRSGEADEIGYFVEEFLQNIGAASEKSLLFKQYILMDIYFTVISFLNDIGADKVYRRNE
ncbi:MAG: response regulator [Clostridiaceae bacterium]|nr:response regulator [Clostridiaceae bacterium]